MICIGYVYFKVSITKGMDLSKSYCDISLVLLESQGMVIVQRVLVDYIRKLTFVIKENDYADNK